MTLPDDAEEIASWSDVSEVRMTLERGNDETVYLAVWRGGASRVVAEIKPDGLIIAEEL